MVQYYYPYRVSNHCCSVSDVSFYWMSCAELPLIACIETNDNNSYEGTSWLLEAEPVSNLPISLWFYVARAWFRKVTARGNCSHAYSLITLPLRFLSISVFSFLFYMTFSCVSSLPYIFFTFFPLNLFVLLFTLLSICFSSLCSIFFYFIFCCCSLVSSLPCLSFPYSHSVPETMATMCVCPDLEPSAVSIFEPSALTCSDLSSYKESPAQVRQGICFRNFYCVFTRWNLT
jgi:hypothetical protein